MTDRDDSTSDDTLKVGGTDLTRELIEKGLINRDITDSDKEEALETLDSEAVWQNYGSELTSSELLEQFAAPMIKTLRAGEDTLADMHTLLVVAAKVWNELVEHDTRAQARTAFSEAIPDWSHGEREELLPLFDGLADRKEELFPNDERIFVDVELTGEVGDAHLDVVAAPPAELIQRLAKG